MNPEYLTGLECRKLLERVEDIRRYGENCPRWRWRGPFCRALQVYAAFWQFREKGEVPLDAASLGLGSRHVKYLVETQREFGKSAPFEELVVYYLAVLDKMQRVQVALDLAKLLGAI